MNAPKCQLIVKDASMIKALRGVAVEIVYDCRVLGSVIGNENDYENFSKITAEKSPIRLK